MLGMMGNRKRLTSMLSAPTYGGVPHRRPDEYSNGETGTGNGGNMAFNMAAMALINAVKSDNPEQLAEAFKSLHKLCHQNM